VRDDSSQQEVETVKFASQRKENWKFVQIKDLAMMMPSAGKEVDYVTTF